MVDVKLVEEVLREEWKSEDESIFAPVDGCIADFWRHDSDSERTVCERARQAALGHRALKLLARMRGDEVDELYRWTGLAIGDADEAEAIIRELRGES